MISSEDQGDGVKEQVKDTEQQSRPETQKQRHELSSQDF
jgi:hypothetical protein